MDIIANKIVYQDFPSLNSNEKKQLSNILKETYMFLQKEFDIRKSLFIERLQTANYQDARAILFLLLPKLIDNAKNGNTMTKLTSIENITTGTDKNGDYKYSLLGVNKYDYEKKKEYLYSFYDIINNQKLLFETIELVKDKLHCNWIDIFPDENNKTDKYKSKFITDYDIHKVYNIGTEDKNVHVFIKKIWDKFDVQNKYLDNIYYLTETKYRDVIYSKDKKKGLNFLEAMYKDIIKGGGLIWGKFYALNWISQIKLYHYYRNNTLLIATGGTGVGKSRFFPKMMLYASLILDNSPSIKVCCTVPRSNVANSNSNIISRDNGVLINNSAEINGKVKKYYYIQKEYGTTKHIPLEKEDRVSKSLLILTDGKFYQKLFRNLSLNNKGQNIFDIVVLDESHEHNTNMDLIITLMKRTLEMNDKIKFIIMSATLDDDEERFRQFYNDIININLHENDKDKISSTYVDCLVDISKPGQKLNYPVTHSFEKHLIDYKKQILPAAIRKTIQLATDKLSSKSRDILLFLPSSPDIAKACAIINKNIPSNVICLPLHSKIREDYQKIITDSPAKQITFSKEDYTDDKKTVPKKTYLRKIIVATDIAEASITIDTLCYVVDTGHKIVVSFDQRTNMSIISKQWISNQSRIQRLGRVGRVGPGEVYFMYPLEKVINIKPFYSIVTDGGFKENLLNLTNVFDKDELLDQYGEYYFIHPNENQLNRDFKKKGNTSIKLKDTKIQYYLDELKEKNFIKTDENRYNFTVFGLIYELLKDFTVPITTNIDTMAFKLSYINSFKYNCKKEILEILVMLWTESDISAWFADSKEWNFTDSRGDYYVLFKILKKFKLKCPKLLIEDYYWSAINKIQEEEYKSEEFDYTFNDTYKLPYFKEKIKEYCNRYGILVEAGKLGLAYSFIWRKERRILFKFCKLNNFKPSTFFNYISNLSYIKLILMKNDYIKFEESLKIITNNSNTNYSKKESIIRCFTAGFDNNIITTNSSGAICLLKNKNVNFLITDKYSKLTSLNNAPSLAIFNSGFHQGKKTKIKTLTIISENYIKDTKAKYWVTKDTKLLYLLIVLKTKFTHLLNYKNWKNLLTLLIDKNLSDDVIEMYSSYKYEYLESRYGNEKVLYYTEKYSNNDLFEVLSSREKRNFQFKLLVTELTSVLKKDKIKDYEKDIELYFKMFNYLLNNYSKVSENEKSFTILTDIINIETSNTKLYNLIVSNKANTKFDHFLIKNQKDVQFTIEEIILQSSKWELFEKLILSGHFKIKEEEIYKMEYYLSLINYLYIAYDIKTGRHAFIIRYLKENNNTFTNYINTSENYFKGNFNSLENTSAFGNVFKNILIKFENVGQIKDYINGIIISKVTDKEKYFDINKYYSIYDIDKESDKIQKKKNYTIFHLILKYFNNLSGNLKEIINFLIKNGYDMTLMPNKKKYEPKTELLEYSKLNKKNKNEIKKELSKNGLVGGSFKKDNENTTNESYHCLKGHIIRTDKQLAININSIVSISFKNNYSLYFSDKDNYCFIKNADNIILCVCVLVDKETNSMHIDNERGHFLHSLCTNPNYRRLGYSTKLINYIFDNIIPHNEMLYLEVDKSNNSAIRLYKKLNFNFLKNKNNIQRYLCRKLRK